MKQISSSSHKRVAVIGLVVGAVGFLAAVLAPAMQDKNLPAGVVFVMFFGVCVVGAVFYTVLHGLADEVWDDGNALLVKDDGREVRIPASEIINVGYSTMTNPPRVTLTLRNATQLGKEVSFIPQRQLSLNPFKRNEIINDLILRIDAARRLR